MSLSALSGWIALGLIPVTAGTAWFLRRFARGTFVVRMRPHFFLGYASLAFAVAHLFTSMGDVGSSGNGFGLWLAALAFAGLAIQSFVGTNLQSPGIFRKPLRRWHTAVFAVVLLLAGGHVLLSGSAGAMMSTAFSTDRQPHHHPKPTRDSIADRVSALLHRE